MDKPAVYLAQNLPFGNAGPNVAGAAGTRPVAVYPAGSSEPVFEPIDVDVRDGEVLMAIAEGELESESEAPGFRPVLAYEPATPFGGGRS